MEDDERITEDTLFLACTRPAMVLGVPVEAMGMNVIVTGFVYLVGHSLLYTASGWRCTSSSAPSSSTTTTRSASSSCGLRRRAGPGTAAGGAAARHRQ